jgi:hypothetical protein
VREACKGEDVSAIKSARDDLERAAHAMSQHLYKASQTAGAGAGTGTPGKDDVQDAEFEVKG